MDESAGPRITKRPVSDPLIQDILLLARPCHTRNVEPSCLNVPRQEG